MSDGRVLLVVDYPGRRPEAHVRDLDLEAGGWDVRYLVTAPPGRELRCASYVDGIVARHRPPVGATVILAYCTGGAIAQELAARLGEDRSPLPMVLFDGAPSRPALIARDFRTAAAQVGGAVAAAELPDEADLLGGPALSDRPEACFAWMRDRLVSLAARALRADGAPEDQAATAAEAICAVYLDWLAYLIAGYNTDRPPWRGEVLHVASRRHIFTEPWPGGGAYRLERVDAPADDLLRSPRTRQLTEAFLNRVPALT